MQVIKPERWMEIHSDDDDECNNSLDASAIYTLENTSLVFFSANKKKSTSLKWRNCSLQI
jgi:hypothetical protein